MTRFAYLVQQVRAMHVRVRTCMDPTRTEGAWFPASALSLITLYSECFRVGSQLVRQAVDPM